MPFGHDIALVNSKSDDTAYHMAWKAAHIFKEHYGDYPERIGLDIKTRHSEYVRRRGNHLAIIEPDPLEKLRRPWTIQENFDSTQLMLQMKRTEISIAPLVFPDLAAWEVAHLNMPLAMPDEVWCQWGDTTAKMSLWFTEQGWHCIEWNEETQENEFRI